MPENPVCLNGHEPDPEKIIKIGIHLVCPDCGEPVEVPADGG